MLFGELTLIKRENPDWETGGGDEPETDLYNIIEELGSLRGWNRFEAYVQKRSRAGFPELVQFD